VFELRESYSPGFIFDKRLICILTQVGWYVRHVNNITLGARHYIGLLVPTHIIYKK